MTDLSIPVPLPITALASSSSPSPLLVAASGPSLLVYTGSSTHNLASTSTAGVSHNAGDQLIPLVRHIAISHLGDYIATVSDDKLLRVYTVATGGAPTRLSSRPVSKKCSDLSFSLSSAGPEPDIVLSDKVGDVYLYPLTPRPVSGDRPAPLALNSDPTLNPDADLLLGHVSVLTAAVLSYDGKSIITSDRDEHIRVSRFPKSYIIERYLFGSDGFISALHVPEGSPSTLISAGGEQWMRIWNWETGEALGKVDIYPAVLPHRRARSNLRRVKRKRNAAQAEAEAEGEAGPSGQAEAPESDLAAGSFYAAPEGYALPSGQGVCIKKIRTVKVGDQTMVLFSSEGAAAIHSFPLSLDPTAPPPTISTLPLDFPLLDFTILPSSSSSNTQIVISLDSTWGILKQNPPAGSQSSAFTPPSITSECQAKMAVVLVVAEVSAEGLTLVPEHPVLTALEPEYASAPASEVSKLQLYPLLPLLPRWAGMEEDDELAGPSAEPVDGGKGKKGQGKGKGKGKQVEAEDAEAEDEVEVDEKKVYTREELEGMSNKMLGRLKSQGVDVEEWFKRRQRRPKGGAGVKKRKVGAGALGDAEEGEQEVEGEDEDIEAQMNQA